MKTIKKYWKNAAALLGVVLTAYLIGLQFTPQTLDLGNDSYPAPDFTLPNVAGRSVSLSDFKGKVVLLDFWATYCLPCLEELPDLKALYRKYESKGFTLVGVSMDYAGTEVVAPFVNEYAVPYPILISDGESVEGYWFLGLPAAFLIDREGNVVKKYLGYKFPEQLDKDVAALLKEKKILSEKS